MAGLRRICRMYGGMIIQGVPWAWDYAADEPVLKSEMPDGSERWKKSERAKYALLAQVDRSPEGQDPRGLDAQHESAVPEEGCAQGDVNIRWSDEARGMV